MSNIAPISADDSSIKLDTKKKAPNQELDKDVFMQLLMTQMKYQDPLKPMDNQEMMAQMAQFTALEQMKNMANMTEKQFAHGLIGQFVQYQHKNTETQKIEYLTGKVDYIKTSGGEVMIGIGENEVTMKDIHEVVDAANIQANLSPFELIQKTVQAVVEKKSIPTLSNQLTKEVAGQPEKIIVEGEVVGVMMKSGNPYVVVGTGEHKMEIDFKNVQNLVEKPSITGKHITATIKDNDGKDIKVEGIAEYVMILKDSQQVYVNGQFVALTDIEYIQNASK